MKKLIVLLVYCLSVNLSYAQSDSLLFLKYEQKVIENNNLKNELQVVNQRIAELSSFYKKDTLNLQKQISDLRNEVSVEKNKVSDLNENKIKKERDHLNSKVDSLNILLSKKEQIIVEKENQITNEKLNVQTTATNAKKVGKEEVLSEISNFYKNKLFDDLIISSTKESIARDMQLLVNNLELKPLLTELQNYFKAQDLLSEKCDAVQIKNAQANLNQIIRQSQLLDALKNNLQDYNDFNTKLKETIAQVVSLDKSKSADGNSVIQKLKFNEIVTSLADYMYNYYDYTNYPYLSNIIIEIIKRKQFDADKNIEDLLVKL